MKAFGLILAVSLGLIAYPAVAQIGIVDGLEIAGACASDVVRLCAGVIPEDGRVKGMESLTKGNPDAMEFRPGDD